MKASFALPSLLLGAALFLGGLAASPGATVYTENFDATHATSLGTYGWNVNYGPNATAFNTALTTGYTVAPNAGSDGTLGYAGAGGSGSSGIGSAVLLWTDTGSFGTIDTLNSLTFSLKDTSTSENLQVALEIGGSWYVTASVFNGNNWQLQTMTPGGVTAWNSLSFTSNSVLSLGGTVSLPTSGTIDAIGFFDADESANQIRLDTIAVNTVPEPSSCAMAAAGLLALLWRARRRTDGAAA